LTGSSRLTPRRRQALDALRALAGGRPAHYSAVGVRLGVSAWTAYGLLRDLETLGLVTRSYALAGAPAGGRSRILFQPTAAASGAPDEADGLLQAAFERFAAVADEAAAARAYLAEAGNDLAWHLGFWLGRLDAAGRTARDAARSVLEGAGRPASKLQAVAALGLGSALARLEADRLGSRLTAASGRLTVLVEEAARVSDARLAALVDAARRLGPGPQPAPRPTRRILSR